MVSMWKDTGFSLWARSSRTGGSALVTTGISAGHDIVLPVPANLRLVGVAGVL